MAEAALCTVWGQAVPGREKHAIEVFNDSMQYWGRLQQEGKIEGFDVAMLTPSGGEVTGFLLVRGTAEQLDSLRRTDEYQRVLGRVQLITDHLRVADAFVDEGLARLMGMYQEIVKEVD